jgi:hypothetical protein
MSRLQLISAIPKFHPSFRSFDMSASCALLGPQNFFQKAGGPVFNIIYLCSNQSDDQDVRTAWRAHESGRHV